jgi:hypothetical protein
MAIVVRGIVHGLDVGEAHTADDENAKQRGHCYRQDASRAEFRDARHGTRLFGR